MTGRTEIEIAVLGVLRTAGTPLHSSAISSHVRIATDREVSRALSRLKRDGLVTVADQRRVNGQGKHLPRYVLALDGTCQVCGEPLDDYDSAELCSGCLYEGDAGGELTLIADDIDDDKAPSAETARAHLLRREDPHDPEAALDAVPAVLPEPDPTVADLKREAARAGPQPKIQQADLIAKRLRTIASCIAERLPLAAVEIREAADAIEECGR